MTKVSRLKREARESATFRGHNLRRFNTVDMGGKKDYHATCGNSGCHFGVLVCLCPPPNGIGISGPAVALNCSTREDG